MDGLSFETMTTYRGKPKRRTKTGGARIRLTPTAAGVIYDGESLDDWDDEELMRGRRRNKHGKFTGRPVQVIPVAIHKELTRRRFSRAHDIMASSLADGALMLRSVVNDKGAEPADRIKAAELLFNRVLGKPRESVAIDFSGSPGETLPWQKMLASSIVASVDEAALLMERERAAKEEEDAIDGEIVEDDDDDAE